ncbi:MAG: MBL fold metallo-hydrolase [Bacteriovoracaceae bacterium]
MLVRVIGGHGGVSPGFKATSYLIDGKLLIDAGSVAEGLHISEQTLVDHILISHPHLDHIKDLAFMCDNCFGLRPNPFEVYSSQTVKDAINNHLMNDLIWPDFSVLPTRENPTIRFHRLEAEQSITLGDYDILPVPVNHQGGAFGFIVTRKNKSVLFTQDTGPTDRIWELAHKYNNLSAIFTEVSFPNHMEKIATASLHHTPSSMKKEIEKMPKDIPIFLGHLKPNFQEQLFHEIDQIGSDRLVCLGSSNHSYLF